MTRPLVIYHANCPDGFTAAWVAARALDGAELFEGRYGDDPPYDLARGRDVYVVDFSYPREKLLALNDAARTSPGGAVARTPWMLRVLDHHRTAEADLQDLPFCTFDMDRSGAALAWDFFHPNERGRRPWIVDYVQDRDLWRFELPNSEEVSLWIRCAGYSLEAWDEMADRLLDDVLEEARGCKRYLDHYVDDALRNAYSVRFEYQIPDPQGAPADLLWTEEPAVAVNVSYTGISDVLNGALERTGVRVAVGWHITSDGDVFCSLRSVKGFDCSLIARHFGGGGHAQASGFRLKLESEAARCLIQPDRGVIR